MKSLKYGEIVLLRVCNRTIEKWQELEVSRDLREEFCWDRKDLIMSTGLWER